jgi:hypothetical protein
MMALGKCGCRCNKTSAVRPFVNSWEALVGDAADEQRENHVSNPASRTFACVEILLMQAIRAEWERAITCRAAMAWWFMKGGEK